jgi:hypothetical protein
VSEKHDTPQLSFWLEYSLLNVMVFSIGHYCSLLIRSSIVAICVSLGVATGIVLFERNLTVRIQLIGLSPTLCMALISVACWLSVWFYVSDWLLERFTWRSIRKMVWWNLCVLGAGSVAWITFRVYQIPWVEPPFSVDALSSAQEINISVPEKYRAACLQLLPAEEDEIANREFKLIVEAFCKELSQLNQDQLQRMKPLPEINAAQAKHRSELVSRYVENLRHGRLKVLAPSAAEENTKREITTKRGFYDRVAMTWTLERGLELEQAKEFSAAFDCYLAVFLHREMYRNKHGKILIWYKGEHRFHDFVLRWANREGQTAETIRQGVEKLVQLPLLRVYYDASASQLAWDTLRVRNYVWRWNALQGNFDPRNPFCMRRRDVLDAATLQYLPWERARQLRLLNAKFQQPSHFRGGYETLGNLDQRETSPHFLYRHLEWNAFITRLQLLAYRAEFGKFPESIYEPNSIYLEQKKRN